MARMLSMASVFADSIKPQVLTIDELRTVGVGG